MTSKIDLRKEYAALYKARPEPEFVAVPELSVLAVDGAGDPNGSQRFQDCVTALYSASFALKFALKKGKGLDWGVLGLEGDWWCDDLATFSMDRRTEWKWTLMIVQPSFVSPAYAEAAIMAARAKKGCSPALADLRFEGRAAHEAAQILHVGPYDAEPPTIARLHEFIRGSGRGLAGLHREVYLSDARRVPEDKLRTIIRQEVGPAPR
jgi:hypothetical protein